MSTLFIGLGRMGAPMVRHYARRHPVLLHDADRGIAQTVAADLDGRVIGDLSRSEALRDIDVTIMMLPSSTVVEAVLTTPGELLTRLPHGGLIIDMGSSEPASTLTLAATAAERGIGYVDAPVSGGVAKAVSGQLSILVGGRPPDVERAQEHLTPMGTPMVVGTPGSGHAVKALNNLLSATNIAAAAEVIGVAAKFGVEPKVMVSALNASTGRSQASEVKYPNHILTGHYDSAFAMDLMLKDLAIAHRLAKAQGAQTPIADTTVRVARQAADHLDGDGLDHTELARLYEQLNGFSFTPPPPPD
ncbi:MAG: NAD(P)-dependent oxidoreductase [Beutenbergiaceae bacterium]